MNTYLQQNLGKLLEDNRMSYTQLANAAGISVDTVKKIFRTKTNGTAYIPSGTTLDHIAKVFHIKPEMLLQPNISQLINDKELVKDIISNKMFNAAIKKADTATKFRIAMVEGGFNTIASMIDYLHFMGYATEFLYNSITVLSEEEIRELKLDVANVLDQYRKKIEENNKEIKRRKVKWKELEDRYCACEDNEETNRLKNEMEKLESDIAEYELENFQLNFLEQDMIEMEKENKIYSSIAEVIAQRMIDVEDAIRILNKMDGLSKRVRTEQLKKLEIKVNIINKANEIPEIKTITLFDFYQKCEEISDFIEGKLFK